MSFFKLISVQWCCIFILYSQRADCASFFSAAEPASSGPSTPAIPSLCGVSNEQYVSDKGPQSSVLLALRPDHGRASAPVGASCKRQFRAPDAYNFFVRLQRVPATGHRSSAGKKKYTGNKASNSTNSCPLTISQSANGELLPSWRLDPCMLETNGGLPDEPMRLLQGKLNIVWNHDGNAPNYRLHLTVVGQGAVCLEREKHSCLEYVGMPLLCIARELICDGLPNCPPLGSDVSDENEAMCAKHRREEYSESPVQSVFRKYFQNTLKSFFGGEPDELATAGPALPSGGGGSIVDIGLEQRFGSFDAASADQPMPPVTTEATVPPKKHRSTLTGLSKYGPWGYLFLGMLICGGALLICGLWECCCRSHKPEQSPDDSLPDPVPSFLQTSPSDGGAGGTRGNATTAGVGLSGPHYGEIDLPPAYSVLFPNQKASDGGDAGGERHESPSVPPSAPSDDATSSPAVAVAGRVPPDVETTGHSRAGNEDPSEPDAAAPAPATVSTQDRL